MQSFFTTELLLGLITIFTGTALPLLRKWKNDFCNKLDNYSKRLELLEFIAMRTNPQLVNEFKNIEGLKNDK